jgi:PAS domain S-box-containing protein
MLTAELLSEALNSAPDTVVLTDSSGCILFASSQIVALLGYDPAEIVGRSIELLLPERLRSRHVAHRTRYGERPLARPMGSGLDLAALRKDGTEVPVEISLSPIRSGTGQQLIAAALRDGTERRRARAELIAARDAADRANEAKGRFLATASHDLRQPLQTLALLNGALRRMLQDSDASEALEQQGQAVDAMSRLLNALLDISKLESGAIQPDPSNFGVGGLFDELRREFAGVAASKGLKLLVAPTQAWAYSDRPLVGQVLRNLVSNAIKYTPHGRVELRCAAGAQSLQIEVQDTGIGIPADEQSRIYDEFYQVGVASNITREGYGLGLSIVRRLVALLQLQIQVQSAPGNGTTFSLTLPRGTVVADTGGAAVRASVTHDRDRAPLVLLVDDDAGVRAATTMLLKVEGYRALAAASLSEAVEFARHNPALALLISDYHLREGETGMHVIAAVRIALQRDLPAIVVTGDTSSTVRGINPADGVHLVSKPIDADQLLTLLKTLLPT